MTSAVLEQFQRVGRDLFVAGLISSHGGNMSVRQGDRILITAGVPLRTPGSTNMIRIAYM